MARKKSHGGLKFLAFLVVVGVVITGLTMGRSTQVGQRITGNREDRRLDRTSLTPRFTYASAALRITIGEIYNNDGTMLDITTMRDVKIDRQSATAWHEVSFDRTSTEVAPGVNAIPVDSFATTYSEIVTKDHSYESPPEDGQPWTRVPVQPWYYGTELDEHYIPMIDDIMGFELRGFDSKPMSVDAKSQLSAVIRPAVNGPAAPSAVTTSYSYEMDMQTYRRAIPILATRTGLTAPPDAPVTVTIGFDEVGLLRYADVAIANSFATTLAQQLGPEATATYHYTLEVTDISGEPVAIEIPASVVDAPVETVPGPTP